MPMNPFASQKETMFIMYDDIIKTSKFLILKKLLTDEYRNNYKDYINYSKIDNLTDEQLYGTVFAATDKNILKYLATKSFDYDATYIDLYLDDSSIISKSKLLSFGSSISILLKQSFLDKIYIYSNHYDENIYRDIYDNFGSTNIIYVYGEFNDVIDNLSKTTKITTYVLNDIDLVNNLIENNKITYTNVLVTNTGWNYKLNDRSIPVLKLDNSDKLTRENIFKLAVFDPDPSASYIRNN